MSTFLVCLTLVIGGVIIGGLMVMGLVVLAMSEAIERGLNW